MSATNGGPAFPRTGIGNAGTQYDVPAQDGMTLRDWFAGMALSGLVGDPTVVVQHDSNKADIAKGCYRLADAMLAAREAK